MKFLVLSVLFCLVSVNATFSWGSCPKVDLQENFDIDSYMGTWYEMIRNKDMPFEKGNCNQAVYTLKPNGQVNVFNSEILGDGKNNSITGYAYCDAKKPAQCHVKFSTFAPAGDYKVVATDYDNYALVFSCFNLGIMHWKWVWILTRNVDFDAMSFLPQIESLGINSDQLYYTSHQNCPAN